MALQFCGTCGQPLLSDTPVCQHCDSPVGNPRAALVDLSMELTAPGDLSMDLTPPVHTSIDQTTTKQTALPVSTKQRTGQGYWFLGLTGALVALALIASGAVLLLLRQPALTPSTAAALVQQFYSDVNARNYSDAYALLSNEWHTQQSLTNFSNGFENTLKDTVKIEGSQTLADGTIQVNVQLQALEHHADGSQSTIIYAGYYIVGKEDGKLRILRGNLSPQTGSSSQLCCTLPALLFATHPPFAGPDHR